MLKMWEIAVGVMLFAGCLWDMRDKHIPVGYLLLFSMMVIGERLANTNDISYESYLGTGIGILFIFVSKISKEQIGYGDSWVIANLGMHLGIWKLLFMLYISFSLCFMWCMHGIVKKKMTKKTRIAFYPFLLAGYVGVIWLEKVL